MCIFRGRHYEVPRRNDQFDLTITPPFGEEQLTLYASTAPLGDSSRNLGPVLEIQTAPEEVARKTRGIKIKARPQAAAKAVQPVKRTCSQRIRRVHGGAHDVASEITAHQHD